MKLIGSLFSVLIGVSVISPVFALTSEDYDVINQNLVSLPAGTVINRDYFAVGETIEISGTVNGDVYVAGGQILINGAVNGDLIATGGQITLNGSVKEDVRILGGQINQNGAIGGNLSVLGGNLNLSQSSVLAGNLIAGAGTLNLASPIAGDAKIAAGTVTLTNRIEGDVLAGIGHMLLGSTGHINGDLVYWGDTEKSVEFTPQATVSGTIEYRAIPAAFHKWQNDATLQSVESGFNTGVKIFRLLSLISSILVGLFILRFFPNWLDRATSVINAQSTSAGLLGLAALIITPFIVLFLFVTLIGFPFAIILAGLYCLALFLSRLVFANWLASFLLSRLNQKTGKNLTLIIGLILYYLICSLIILGPIFALIGMIMGLGAIILTNKTIYLSARQSKLV